MKKIRLIPSFCFVCKCLPSKLATVGHLWCRAGIAAGRAGAIYMATRSEASRALDLASRYEASRASELTNRAEANRVSYLAGRAEASLAFDVSSRTEAIRAVEWRTNANVAVLTINQAGLK